MDSNDFDEIPLKSVKNFFDYAGKRQDILLRRKAGYDRADWTSDPILEKYRFCNVFREDDKVTKWAAKNIRKKFTGADLVFACIMFRMFNRPETMQKILDADGVLNFNVAKLWKAIKDEKPVINAAYIVIGDRGHPKGLGILHTLKPLSDKRNEIHDAIKQMNTLEGAVQVLTGFKWVGDFIAYEAVTDLRHTKVLNRAKDIMTWANPGPGAARGLSRLLGLPKDHYNRNSKRDREQMFKLMQDLLKQSGDRWSGNESWEMRDIEHTLCEFDKYERARTGEGRPKQLYRYLIPPPLPLNGTS